MSDRHEPHLGVSFPLADFTQRIMSDSDVLGMLYTGSRGRGQADRCSDVDIMLWLRDEALAKPGRIEHYLGWLGEIHFVSWSQDDQGQSSRGYVGSDWQRVELDIVGSRHPMPHPFFHHVTVVKDTDSRLASLVAASGPPMAELTRDAARSVIEEILYEIGAITMQNIRGSRHRAVSALCEYANTAYTLLAQLRGREGYDVRFVERFLHADELALLEAAWPATFEPEEIRRAVRGLWLWTRYAWTQAEQTLGEELGISLDVAAFLEAIERLYGWNLPAAHEG
jgi:hypothetical protein